MSEPGTDVGPAVLVTGAFGDIGRQTVTDGRFRATSPPSCATRSPST
jgi:hypothetical protein